MKKYLSLCTVFFVAVFLLASCTTTIHTTIERPAELDLNGAETMAVLPFQINSYGYSGTQTFLIIGDVFSLINDMTSINNGSYDIADYLTRQLEKGISGSQYVELVYSDAVKGALNAGKTPPCDVYLTGHISGYQNEVKEVNRTVKINGQNTKVLYYYRCVEFTLTYQVVDSESNRIITSISEDVYSTSDEYEDWRDLPDAMKTVRSELDYLVRLIMKKIQPYTETKYISLLKDKTKDPDMKTADKYVKNGLLDAGRSLYLELYRNRGYFEAGYNAAIILEAQGKYTEAYEEMYDLVRKSGDKRAISALNDIQYEIDSRKTLQEQIER